MIAKTNHLTWTFLQHHRQLNIYNDIWLLKSKIILFTIMQFRPESWVKSGLQNTEKNLRTSLIRRTDKLLRYAAILTRLALAACLARSWVRWVRLVLMVYQNLLQDVSQNTSQVKRNSLFKSEDISRSSCWIY